MAVLGRGIDRQAPGTHTVVVGYSLGANSSVFVANTAKYVDLIIALQPSMLSWNPPVTGKVGRMVEIYNPNPWMTFVGMGSKKLIGENIEYIANYDSHPRAQFNSEFRSLVKSETAKFAANVRPETAQAVASRPNKLAQLPQSGTKPAEEKLTHSQRDLRAKDHLQIAQAEMPKLQKRAEFEQVADGRQKQQQRQSTAFLDLPIEFGEFGGRVRSAATNNCRSEGLCRENLPWFGYGPVDDNSLAGPRLSRQLRQLQPEEPLRSHSRQSRQVPAHPGDIGQQDQVGRRDLRRSRADAPCRSAQRSDRAVGQWACDIGPCRRYAANHRDDLPRAALDVNAAQ